MSDKKKAAEAFLDEDPLLRKMVLPDGRTAYYVDAGDMSPSEAKEYMERVRAALQARSYKDKSSN